MTEKVRNLGVHNMQTYSKGVRERTEAIWYPMTGSLFYANRKEGHTIVAG